MIRLSVRLKHRPLNIRSTANVSSDLDTSARENERQIKIREAMSCSEFSVAKSCEERDFPYTFGYTGTLRRLTSTFWVLMKRR